MRIFIGQAVTGENLDRLYAETGRIRSSLERAGHEPYSTLEEDEKEFRKRTKKKMLEHAFGEIAKSGAFLAIVRSEKRSEGMLIEVGYSMSLGKKLVLAVRREVRGTYLRELADRVMEFESVNELCRKLEKLRL